uniref:hypothetical protein n=1 Tax=Alistipes sp. TaxID=1872444 RepID=UPI0040566649
MKRFSIFLTLCAVLMVSSASAQVPQPQQQNMQQQMLPQPQPPQGATSLIKTGFTDFVTSSFINYYASGGIHEKLYLVTDKPYYSAGDKIFFSAFLVNATYFQNTTDTRYIYVELIDATGNAVECMRVQGSGGRFHNAIALSTKITPGKYTLRAYSKWQTNFDKELLFSKIIDIGNYIDDAVRTKISYEFDKTGRVVAIVEVTNNHFAPIPQNAVEYSLNIDGKTTNHMTQTDANGLFRFSFRPSANNSDCIRLHINANGRKLDRKVQLPSFEDDFSVKFMPEGGNLIQGIEQVVAFKAVGVDGHAVNVNGVIRTKSGEEVCTINSKHDGMGKFLLTAQPEESYIATLTTDNGVSRSFTLPTAATTGCAIRITPDVDNRLLLKVTTTEDLPVQRLVAIVQSRGIVNYVVENLTHALRIPLDKLRSGVANVSIVDKATRTVIAQRLFFVRGPIAKATITPSVKKFSPRELVNIDFAIKNSKGTPIKGDFVASVVDDALLKKSSQADNILSYLLLNSDLKGHIENPTYYFEGEDAVRNENLDLVMLTHGWRRYSINNILAGKKPVLRHQFESEQYISGRVAEAVGKARNTSVMIFRNKKEYLGVHPLNKTNRFHITGIDSPDTTIYVLQALNRDGSSNRVRIKVDPYIYPKMPFISREVFQNTKTPSLTEEYMMRSKQTYFEDGGIPVIDIDAVEIVAKRTESYEYSAALNDFNTVSGDMTRFSSIFDALQRFKQLEIVGNNVYVNSSKMSSSPADATSNNPDASDDSAPDVPDTTVDVNMEDKEDLMPAVYVNGQQMDMNVIDAYPMSEVISVSYLDKFESMAAGMSSETGTIVLHVRNIDAREKLLIKSMAEIIVPGYATPTEFYAPDYSVKNDRSKRDNRTTIAWVPSLQSNSLGDASISFWTADRPSNYRIAIEGITSEGELLYNEMILQAK